MSVNPFSSRRAPDRGDAAVHHVGGRDDVRAGARVREGASREQRQGRVVVDLAVADHAAVSVRRVLVEADVGHHHEFRRLLLQPPDGGLHGRLVVPALAARLVLLLRDAEQDDGRDAGGRQLLAPRRAPRPERAGRLPGATRSPRALPALPDEERRDERSGERRVSRTRRRRAGLRRRRRRTRRREGGHAARIYAAGRRLRKGELPEQRGAPPRSSARGATSMRATSCDSEVAARESAEHDGGSSRAGAPRPRRDAWRRATAPRTETSCRRRRTVARSDLAGRARRPAGSGDLAIEDERHDRGRRGGAAPRAALAVRVLAAGQEDPPAVEAAREAIEERLAPSRRDDGRLDPAVASASAVASPTAATLRRRVERFAEASARSAGRRSRRRTPTWLVKTARSAESGSGGGSEARRARSRG